MSASPPSNLGRRAARGAAVSLTGSGARTLIQIGGVIILARMLTPGEYGLLAMVSVIIGIADIFRNFGLYTVAVRASSLSVAQRSNLFWMNLGIGVALCVGIFLAAPLIALMYREPLLVPVARALAFTFILSGASTQFRASLARDLAFAQLAIADTLAPAVALAVGIYGAWQGWGFHALVAQQLTLYATMLALLMLLARWRPQRYDRSVPMRQMWSLGWGYVTIQLINYVGNNADQFIIGLRYGSIPTGLYNRAFQLLMQPYNQVRVPVTDVGTPILAKVQDDDREFLRVLSRAQITLGYTVGWALALVAAGSAPLVHLFLGDRWEAIVPLFALLAVAALCQLVDFVAGWAFTVRAMMTTYRRYTLVTTVIRVVTILAGSHFGVLGVAAGYAAVPFVMWPVTFVVLGRFGTLPTRELISNGLRIVSVNALAGGLAFAVVLATAGLPDILRLLLDGLTGAGVVALVALAVPAVRRDLQSCVAFARLLGPDRASPPAPDVS
ncbi:Lipopolysaccharide biosynthesis protein WzxC [Austwickia sp. TVS 96-490-7B]|uniref:lipopolysaccharide biosynthesis protein n=1 Tax=Austwickia sp. TVS 96-490-7B TaxID=2830843 RepID=UPI001C580954|nr:lipopolysaccharide biosynthesis protein [Austwickia sp. TVS 96-490-7B]MBW3084131.1 Lipopolysaccharide biosynthesis protein WzxC [Austwickia sp. TVS 96-490-7B]